MIPLLTNPNFWQTFAQSTVSTPAYEIMLLLVMTTVCLLTRWSRLGLLLVFGYVYRWGWIFMRQEFSTQTQLIIGYSIAGIIVIVGSIIAFMMDRDP